MGDIAVVTAALATQMSIPITVFTGFLGAGKTSIILSLLPQLPKDYKAVLLKNEFGDVEIDSKLAQQSSLAAVSEILNGCMCCVLVGQMQTALLEIRDNYRPNRIIIECSGSAFPATLAFQIRELERQTSGGLKLDSIVTVVDVENFTGYEDTSPTARMQASYTDMILLNKWEHVSEETLDRVIDLLNTLNDQTPKIRCNGRNGVDPNLIFGLETTLFEEPTLAPVDLHHEEVETATIFRGQPRSGIQHEHHTHCSGCSCDPLNHISNVQHQVAYSNEPIKAYMLDQALSVLSKETIWRVKGFIRMDDGLKILNWAFGRYDMTPFHSTEIEDEPSALKLTVMGERGEVRRSARRLAATLSADIVI